MKTLYNKKGQVHPSPPPPPPTPADHHHHHYLSLLPATILTLTAALSPEDKQILAYLISCSANFTSHQKTTQKSYDDDDDGDDDHGHHDPVFECSCFNCYMSFWVRWDTSPNRQVIHEIIEAYEEGLFQKRKKSFKKKKKKKGKRVAENGNIETKNELGDSYSLTEKNSTQDVGFQPELENGGMRKITSFLGDKIWGLFNSRE